VETVLQALELADDVELSPRSDDRVILELSGAGPGTLGPDADNLALRAAQAFRKAVAGVGGGAPGVTIRLHKRIPHAAGLGGGSSDGAAVLRGMNDLLGGPLATADLVALAAGLGSDVPFFVLDRPRALAWGRGEKTLVLPALAARPVLVAVPAEPMATSWAYRELDAHRASHPTLVTKGLVDPAEEGGWRAVAVRARNDFEDALFPLKPDLARVKAILHESGARPALLSGSGSALFGVFEDAEAAARAEAALLEEAATVAKDGPASGAGTRPGLRTFRTRTRT
jgi:4-diphosphocytidyl-2-C-methyl-D-erythritol kinase